MAGNHAEQIGAFSKSKKIMKRQRVGLVISARPILWYLVDELSLIPLYSLHTDLP